MTNRNPKRRPRQQDRARERQDQFLEERGLSREGHSGRFNDAAANQNYAGFKAKSARQQEQADMIDANDIVFSIGPAGTGKTHVAMAKAVEALKNKEVDSILLARPAVEAGKTIGFLPGDQNSKMAPYMRPLYDELDKVYGAGNYQHMIRSESNPAGVIEVAPIGTMRGRTFERAFVIIDEAQNLLTEELKMALTRLGEGSKMVVTGDPGQIDLNPDTDSGLMDMVKNLEGVESVAVHRYGAEDVMRHPTVRRIVDRLEGKKQENQPVTKPSAP
jgi:phosphate starvation-inducible PhoH-like protein